MRQRKMNFLKDYVHFAKNQNVLITVQAFVRGLFMKNAAKKLKNKVINYLITSMENYKHLN